MSTVTSLRVLRALEAAGIIRAEDNVKRVVIDLDVREPAVIHVQRWGDARLLDVVPTLGGVEIRREPAAVTE